MVNTEAVTDVGQ